VLAILQVFGIEIVDRHKGTLEGIVFLLSFLAYAGVLGTLAWHHGRELRKIDKAAGTDDLSI
jgi:hypothetical protein